MVDIISVYRSSMSYLSRDESDDEEALVRSLVHSTLTCALPPTSIRHSDIHLETTLSPSAPVCLQKKALLIGIQYYDSTNAQLDGEGRLIDTPAGEQLKGPHADVQNMRQLLLGKAFHRYPHGFLRSDHFFLPDCYDFNPDDITVLIDDGDPKHVQPTKENLVSVQWVCAIFLCLNNQFFVKDAKHERPRSWRPIGRSVLSSLSVTDLWSMPHRASSFSTF